MVFECIPNDSVAVDYWSSAHIGMLILYQGTKTSTGFTYSQIAAYFGSTADTFYWTISEKTSKRLWRAIGTISAYNSTTESFVPAYWYNPQPIYSGDGSLTITQGADGAFKTNAVNRDSSNGDVSFESNLKISTLAIYNQAITNKQVVVQSGAKDAYWDENRASSSLSIATWCRSPAITHIFRYPSSIWNINVFKNGQQIATLEVQNIPSDPFNSPPIASAPCPGDSTFRQTLLFEKLPDTQAFEATVSPDLPHRKTFWLVSFDDSGIETDRQILAQLYSCPGQPPPDHYVWCGAVVRCPDDTCEVECGNTICCYNSNGISVFNFPKP